MRLRWRNIGLVQVTRTKRARASVYPVYDGVDLWIRFHDTGTCMCLNFKGSLEAKRYAKRLIQRQHKDQLFCSFVAGCWHKAVDMFGEMNETGPCVYLGNCPYRKTRKD